MWHACRISRSPGRWGEVSLKNSPKKVKKLFIHISELRNTPDVIFYQSRYTELLRKKKPEANRDFCHGAVFCRKSKNVHFLKK